MSSKAIDGKPVIDAKRPITITVNPKDIATADIKKPDSCAFAQACRRELKVKEVRVHLGRVYLRNNENNWVRYLTPHNLRNEIIAFDRGGKFIAGEFQLMAPTPTKKLGKAKGSLTNKTRAYKLRKKRDSAPGYKKRPYHVMTDVRNGPA